MEICRLSKRWRTNNSFIPHVTLVGGIECDLDTARHGTQQLVDSVLKPVDIQIKMVGYGDTFHQTVFLHVNKTEHLIEQHRLVSDAFAIGTPQDLFMPHMSLIYHHMSQEDRILLAQEEEKKMIDIFPTEESRILRQVNMLELWYTPANDTSLQTWKCVDSYVLK